MRRLYESNRRNKTKRNLVPVTVRFYLQELFYQYTGRRHGLVASKSCRRWGKDDVTSSRRDPEQINTCNGTARYSTLVWKDTYALTCNRFINLFNLYTILFRAFYVKPSRQKTQRLRRISPKHAPLIDYEFGLPHLEYILHSDLNLTGKYAQPNSHSAGCWVLPFSRK